jgi:choline dehydrogenase-like flavoprotein
MEHPHFSSAGEVVMDEPLDEYWPAGNAGRGFHAIILVDEVVRREGLYACSLQCASKNADHEMAVHMTRTVGRPFFHYDMTVRAEMRPSERNRVFLTAEREPSGMLRPAARCVLDAQDFQSIEETLRLLGVSLLSSGKGRVRVNNDRIYKHVQGGGHTMGTTRMGTSRTNSVVDRDCRVHGYANLFVAGSSVFATGGYANPTLTIVALSLRLADTIDGQTKAS